MKKLIWLAFLILGLSSVSTYSQNAYIQVISEPNVKVFIDNQFNGITNTEINGLIVENITPGKHTIKLIKEGFNPQQEIISLEANEVLSFRVQPFTPKIKISQRGNTKDQGIERSTGKLIIQSLPISIVLSIPQLGINDFKKSEDQWIAEEIPIGKYLAIFSYGEKEFQETIEVKRDLLTHIIVKMLSLEIEILSETAINDEQNRNSNPGNLNSRSHLKDNSLMHEIYTDPRDGKKYKTIEIGNQVWMAENMAYYINDKIYYPNGSVLSLKDYGLLYQHKEAVKVCPSGWKLPSKKDFQALFDYFGGRGNPFRALSVNGSSGFSAQYAGKKSNSMPDYYEGFGYVGYYWTSTKNIYNPNYIEINKNSRQVSISYTGLAAKYSVRCIKD